MIIKKKSGYFRASATVDVKVILSLEGVAELEESSWNVAKEAIRVALNVAFMYQMLFLNYSTTLRTSYSFSGSSISRIWIVEAVETP